MNILDYATVELDDENKAIKIIDQTLLPGRTEIIALHTAQEIWDAIYLLKVRGAPAIGVAAGFGIYLLAVQIWEEMAESIGDSDMRTVCAGDTEVRSESAGDIGDISAERLAEFLEKYHEKSEYLNSSRPTAVNLSWALRRMEALCRGLAEAYLRKTDAGDDALTAGSGISGVIASMSEGDVSEYGGRNIITYILSQLREESKAIQQEDIDTCRKIGEYGLTLVKPGDGILTHCNAGQLATSKYGTATAPIYLGQEKGYNFRVFADETRPLLQGARLTSFELKSAGVDVTLICDNMSGLVMRNGWVNAVFVGCDRVAANGDVANKIGTSVVATVAKRFGVPFYVCAPTSTIDPETPTGDDIHIEQRPASEVTDMWYREPMGPEGVKVYNPAFDITDNEYITAIVTEKGILYPPFADAIKKIR